ncbi:type one serine/threonine protein phosphatase 2 [Striga asiatica]|uniref:Type one serine/threonine protein phosphatase 2 n=1 Tax=Striga asiatica TaxID=4170 RepID=A0A5A7QKN0_STRAF|nr:type one serine/threonine protein phosphatase 2 [Striga asiatica]
MLVLRRRGNWVQTLQRTGAQSDDHAAKDSLDDRAHNRAGHSSSRPRAVTARREPGATQRVDDSDQSSNESTDSKKELIHNEFTEDDDNRSRGSNHRERRRSERLNLIMPTYNGIDVNSWLSRANHYFEIINILNAERVKFSAYYLDGEANIWWQWLSRVYKEKDTRFGSSDYHDYDESRLHIKKWKVYLIARRSSNEPRVVYVIAQKGH